VLSSRAALAFEHVTDAKDLGTVVGYAGTGKSAMLGVAREAWERAGYRVQGLALSGIAAENLESGSGIASRTIASIEHQWAQGRDLLTPNHVLVIDEAGMIGSRQMERVVAKPRSAAPRSCWSAIPNSSRRSKQAPRSARCRAARQRRDHRYPPPARGLAARRHAGARHGPTGEALHAYEEHGRVHAAETREQARGRLIDRWDRERAAAPTASRIILTHTNDEVQALNETARHRLRAGELLGEDVSIGTERGQRTFASGDRIMFLKNERGMGVKNGSLGIVRNVTSARMAVMLDDGRAVAFDLKDYAQVDHGYAATIHKAQGVTVDRVHVLATPGLDRHAAYVALSRHRDTVDLHYGRDDFADQAKLVRTLSRERSKDMASDYTRDFADRRQIRLPEPVVERAKPTPARDPFAGLDLRPVSPPPARSIFDGLARNTSQPMRSVEPPGLNNAVQRFARATADIMRMRRDGYTELPHQKIAYDKARGALDAVRPDAVRDLRAAFGRDRGLIEEAAQGRTSTAIRAMALEAELRVSPERRADRFVEDWQKLAKAHRSFRHAGDEAGVRAVRQQMSTLGKNMERDAQAESLIRKRLPELGIQLGEGASISHNIQNWLGLSRGRGLGR
jgi:hypothetical protein